MQILWKVELPNAMFVIYAGIRTALAINVGTVPLAFLIGGGGLGELIFSGIALNEFGMMLAGAIPTALLAILVDFSDEPAAAVDDSARRQSAALTGESRSSRRLSRNQKEERDPMKSLTKILAAAFIAVFAGTSAQAATIVVGGKNFTEQLLLAEMTAQLLKTNGFDVEKRDGMGSQVVRDAQVNGQVDVYWEYTGTSLVTYNKITERMNAKDTYKKVKELDAKTGLTWLNPSDANDTYALAVQASNPKTDPLKTLSDLAAAYNNDKGLVMAVNAEFPKRPDGLPGLEKAYGFKTTRADLKAMDSGLTYQALKEGQVDIALVFATDGRIKAFNFRVLKDDKEFFPNYAIAPVVRTDTLKANPGLAEPLNALSAKLTDDVMQKLNAEVDVDKKSIEDVASGFLTDNGLIQP